MRKNNPQRQDEKSSTNKINHFLHAHNENKCQVIDRPASTNDQGNNDQGENKAFVLNKSYRPAKPPTFTKEQEEKFAENAKNIRTDGHNLRFDEKRQMYFYLPKDHPEYKEHPEPGYGEESNSYISRSCIIL